MKEIIKKQKTLILAQELQKISNSASYSEIKDIFGKYGIDRFDPCKIQNLINIFGIELSSRILEDK